MSPALVPTLTLPHGAEIPLIGLGTWPLDDAGAETAVARALETGYRHVDTAYAYGNERGVGRGLRASGVPREEVFVTSKFDVQWHSVDGVQEAFRMSVDKLGTDYLDLFLIHWPNPGRDRYVDAYRGLVRLLEQGHVRAIGISNFKPVHTDRVLDATGVVPDVNQIELDPRHVRAEVRSYHARKGIATESYSPLGQGRGLLEEPVVVRLAERRGRTPAQVVLRWHVQQGLIAIPKSADRERQRENLAVFDFELTADELAELSALDRGEGDVTDSDSFGH
jgi:2,5-diketo-D-gluconate reductase A